jgi:zinc transport system substrate-binding protein
VVELAEIPALKRLPYRAGGAWDDHEDEDEHGEAQEEAHGAHGEIDMHLWLDPDNAKAIVAAVAEALARADPDNSGIYLANTKIMSYRLDQLAQEVEYDLAAVKDAPFVVFHDAFQYFDTRFALNNVGSVTVDPDRQPGAARLKQIRAKIAELGARCVFAEPQFEPRLLEVVTEGTQAQVGLLDPLGADIPDGPELYFELLRRNAAALKDCLEGAG